MEVTSHGAIQNSLLRSRLVKRFFFPNRVDWYTYSFLIQFLLKKTVKLCVSHILKQLVALPSCVKLCEIYAWTHSKSRWSREANPTYAAALVKLSAGLLCGADMIHSVKMRSVPDTMFYFSTLTRMNELCVNLIGSTD